MYKIGQRVQVDYINDEFYVMGYCPGDNKYELSTQAYDERIFVCADQLDTFYKPGDTVKIKSREELNNIICGDANDEWLSCAGRIVTLKEKETDSGWRTQEKLPDDFMVHEYEFEWHQPEEKPEIAVDLAKPGSDETLIWSKSYFEELLRDIPPKERNRLLYGEWLPEPEEKGGITSIEPDIVHIEPTEVSPLMDFLNPTIDREPHIAGITKEPRYEYKEKKYSCPNCEFIGSKHDVWQHCLSKHGEGLPSKDADWWWNGRIV